MAETLTLLFTMFSNYRSQGPWEPPGGDNSGGGSQAFQFAQLLYHWLSLKATHVSHSGGEMWPDHSRDQGFCGQHLITPANL